MAHLHSLAAPEPARDGWQDIYDDQGQPAGESRDPRPAFKSAD